MRRQGVECLDLRAMQRSLELHPARKRVVAAPRCRAPRAASEMAAGAFCGYAMPSARRFPLPWSIEPHSECFIVHALCDFD